MKDNEMINRLDENQDQNVKELTQEEMENVTGGGSISDMRHPPKPIGHDTLNGSIGEMRPEPPMLGGSISEMRPGW